MTQRPLLLGRVRAAQQRQRRRPWGWVSLISLLRGSLLSFPLPPLLCFSFLRGKPGLLDPRPHISSAATPIESVKLCICHVLNPIRFLLGGEILQLLIEFPQTPLRLFGSQRRPLRHFLVLTVALAVGVLAVAGGPPVRAVRTAVAGLYGPRAALDIPSGSRVVSAATALAGGGRGRPLTPSPTRISAGLSASGVDDAGGASADGIGSGGRRFRSTCGPGCGEFPDQSRIANEARYCGCGVRAGCAFTSTV